MTTSQPIDFEETLPTGSVHRTPGILYPRDSPIEALFRQPGLVQIVMKTKTGATLTYTDPTRLQSEPNPTSERTHTMTPPNGRGWPSGTYHPDFLVKFDKNTSTRRVPVVQPGDPHNVEMTMAMMMSTPAGWKTWAVVLPEDLWAAADGPVSRIGYLTIEGCGKHRALLYWPANTCGWLLTWQPGPGGNDRFDAYHAINETILDQSDTPMSSETRVKMLHWITAQ